jgi:hypothetical protein
MEDRILDYRDGLDIRYTLIATIDDEVISQTSDYDINCVVSQCNRIEQEIEAEVEKQWEMYSEPDYDSEAKDE